MALEAVSDHLHVGKLVCFFLFVPSDIEILVG